MSICQVLYRSTHTSVHSFSFLVVVNMLKYDMKRRIPQRRCISDFMTFPVASPKYPYKPEHENGRLKVQLLKAPSHFGHFSARMTRPSNEDRYSANFIALPVIRNDYGLHKQVSQNCFVASIFDGHGGSECSEYLSQNFHRFVEGSDPSEKKLYSILSKYDQNVKGYWTRLYSKREEIYKSLKPNEDFDTDDLKLRISESCLELDYEILNKFKNSGSTATSVFIYNLDTRDQSNLYYNPDVISKLVISQIGDTKCIICDKNGQARPLSSIHHPDSSIELKRLGKYSTQIFTDSFGERRFLNYENTRSFGDLRAKSKGISAEPDCSSFIIGSSSTIAKDGLINRTVGKLGGDECFLVLVTDGVTNFASDQEIVDLIQVTHNNKIGGTPQDGAEEVVKFVEAVGGDDNATCLVIRLSGWGKWPVLDRTGALREDRLNQSMSMRRM